MSEKIAIRFPTKTTHPTPAALFRSNAPYLRGVSGYGGGKTYLLVHWALKMAAFNPGLRLMLVEPTHGMVNDILIPCIEEVCRKNDIKFELRRPQNRSNWYLPQLGFTALLRSGEIPEHLVGPNLCGVGIDEAGLQKFGVWRQAIARVRDKRAQLLQALAVGTPDELNWFYSTWQDNLNNPDYESYHWTTQDNAGNVSGNYVESMRENYDDLHFRAYAMGEFVQLTHGVVFSNFSDVNIIEPEKATPRKATTDMRIPADELYWSMDFNVDPMTAVLWLLRGDELIACDEVILRHSHVEETAKYLLNKYPWAEWPQQTIICDATGSNRSSTTGASHVDILKQAGYKVIYRHVANEQDAINSARRMVCDAAGRRRLFISKACNKLITSIKVWSYKDGSLKTKEEEYRDNDKMYFVPHLADNVKYICYNLFPTKRPEWRIL